MNPEDTYRRIVESWNRHDPEAVASQYADEVRATDPSYPEPLRGRGAIREDFANLLAGFPDLQGEISNVCASGDRIAFELHVSGTNTGPISLPDGSTIAATGRHAELDFGVFAEVDRAGRVVEETRYYDPAGQLLQLGVTEAGVTV